MEHKKIRVLFVGKSDVTVHVVKVISQNNIMRSKFVVDNYEIDFKFHNIENSFAFDNNDHFDGVFFIDHDTHYKNLYFSVRECKIQSRVCIMNNYKDSFPANIKWFNDTEKLCGATNTKLFVLQEPEKTTSDELLFSALNELLKQIEQKEYKPKNAESDLKQIGTYISFMREKALIAIKSYTGYKPSVTDKNFDYALTELIDYNDEKSIRRQFAILSTKIRRVSENDSMNQIVWANTFE
jgi:hypothetical protein